MAETPEGGGSGSGGAAAGSWPGRPRGLDNRRWFGRLRAAREQEGHPGFRGDDGKGRRLRLRRAARQLPRRARERGPGLAAGRGEQGGRGRAPPTLQRNRARAEKMAQSFVSRNRTQKWSLKSGVSERKLLLGGGAAGSELLRSGKQDEVGWVLDACWKLWVQTGRDRTPRGKLRQGSGMGAQNLTEFT